MRKYKDGEPCGHPGCLNHVTHPCEGCGRVAGRRPQEDPRNEITSWKQGYFVDQVQYRGWSSEMKAKAQRQEEHLVRPSPTGNAICCCNNPDDAKWIAARLNLAAKLERENEITHRG